MCSAAWARCSPRRARAALLLAGAVALGVAAPARAQRASYEELQTFSAVLNQIRLAYVDSVGQAELVRSAIAGALNVLDPHSNYMRAATLDRLTAARGGIAGWVGARLEHDGSGVVVLSTGSGSPAARAGVRAGHRLLAVNDTPTAGLSADEAEALLAGDVGSTVRLRLARGTDTAAAVVVKVKRAKYAWPAVPAAVLLDGSTGYVRLEEFATGSARELERAIRKLRGDGAGRIILDLRGNPGGLVAEAITIAGLFLPKNALVGRVVGRGGRTEELRSDGGGLRELPLVVLVDAGSASASELVAAALQDHDRARIAGRRSFGKALMQRTFPLPHGDVLALTTARIQSPAGRSLQREFRGLNRAQYYAMAGDSGSAPAVVNSLGGRPLDGGPGVAPDTTLPPPPEAPDWWADALEAGLELGVADEAAAGLGATEPQWSADTAAWAALAERLLERARPLLARPLQPSDSERSFVARTLAARVAQVKWGEAAAARFLAATDPDVSAARTLFR